MLLCGYTQEECSSIIAWARREHRIPPREQVQKFEYEGTVEGLTVAQFLEILRQLDAVMPPEHPTLVQQRAAADAKSRYEAENWT